MHIFDQPVQPVSRTVIRICRFSGTFEDQQKALFVESFAQTNFCIFCQHENWKFLHGNIFAHLEIFAGT